MWRRQSGGLSVVTFLPQSANLPQGSCFQVAEAVTRKGARVSVPAMTDHREYWSVQGFSLYIHLGPDPLSCLEPRLPAKPGHDVALFPMAEGVLPGSFASFLCLSLLLVRCWQPVLCHHYCPISTECLLCAGRALF